MDYGNSVLAGLPVYLIGPTSPVSQCWMRLRWSITCSDPTTSATVNK